MRRFDYKDSGETAEILISAEDEITRYLRSHDNKVVHDDCGDIELAVEKLYPIMLGRFLEKRGIHPAIISEGVYIPDFEGGKRNCILFLDPFEGSTNFHSRRLPYGVNIEVFPEKKGDVLVQDWKTSFVTDRKNSIKYVAHTGQDKDNMFVIDRGERRPPNKDRKGPIVEIPMGYGPLTNDVAEYKQMAYYLAIKHALGDNQYRSVDSTGPRIADVIDGSNRVYVEGRELEKLGGAWNIIPSATIINAGGGKATHLDGTPFESDIVWSPERFPNTMYNPDIGRDILATNNIDDYQTCLAAIKPILGRELEYHMQKLHKLVNP